MPVWYCRRCCRWNGFRCLSLIPFLSPSTGDTQISIKIPFQSWAWAIRFKFFTRKGWNFIAADIRKHFITAGENFNGVEQVNAGQRDHPPARDVSLEKPSAKGVMNSNILTLRSIEIRRLGVLSWRRNSLCHLGMDLFLRNAKSGFVRFEAYSSLCRGRKERKDFVRKKGNRFWRFFRPFIVLSVVKYNIWDEASLDVIMESFIYFSRFFCLR